MRTSQRSRAGSRSTPCAHTPPTAAGGERACPRAGACHRWRGRHLNVRGRGSWLPCVRARSPATACARAASAAPRFVRHRRPRRPLPPPAVRRLSFLFLPSSPPASSAASARSLCDAGRVGSDRVTLAHVRVTFIQISCFATVRPPFLGAAAAAAAASVVLCLGRRPSCAGAPRHTRPRCARRASLAARLRCRPIAHSFAAPHAAVPSRGSRPRLCHTIFFFFFFFEGTLWRSALAWRGAC